MESVKVKNKIYSILSIKTKSMNDLPLSYLEDVLKSAEKNNPQTVDTTEAGVDQTSTRYKLLLQLLNTVLTNTDGQDEIDKATLFVNIDRDDINKDENLEKLDEAIPEICKHYNNRKIKKSRASKFKVSNTIRSMCKEIGLQLVANKKDISTGKSSRKLASLYTIIVPKKDE